MNNHVLVNDYHYTPHASLLYVLAMENASNLISNYHQEISYEDVENEVYATPMLAAIAYEHREAIRSLLSSDRLLRNHPNGILQTEKLRRPRLPPSQLRYRADKTLMHYMLLTNDDAFTLFLASTGLFETTCAVMSEIIEGYRRGSAKLFDSRFWGKLDVNILDRDGIHMLHVAASSGNDSACAALLDRGVDVDIKTSTSSFTLYQAVSSGHVTTTKLLLDRGATIDQKHSFGFACLHEAIFRGRAELVQVLLSRGADINIQDGKGKTSIWEAVYQEHENIVELLLAHGADLSIPDNQGKTVVKHWQEQGSRGHLLSRLKQNMSSV